MTQDSNRKVREVRAENSYGKTDYDPLMFKHRVREAVERSMGLCHDPIRLKSEMGSNLGVFVMDMRSARTS